MKTACWSEIRITQHKKTISIKDPSQDVSVVLTHEKGIIIPSQLLNDYAKISYKSHCTFFLCMARGIIDSKRNECYEKKCPKMVSIYHITS
jgi:hypothetical protein